LLFLGIALAMGSTVAFPVKADKATQLQQQMEAASTRYREAQLKLRKGDETAMAEMSKALEDIEDLVPQCLKLKPCGAGKVVAVYEALLKEHDLGPQEALAGEGSDDADPHAHPISPIVSGSPEAQRSLNLLDSGHQFDRMVETTEPIQAAIRDWLTTQRAFLIDAWENYQYMRYLMFPEYERAGLPEALLFGIMAKESGGKVHSISRAGASGPLQFMSATGSRFGLGRDGSGFDTRFDPQYAARANAAYINERFAELNRNLEFTIAAYNGGEGRAARLYSGNGGASFWSPQVFAQMPPETRDYVPAVIAAAWLFLHPKQYGLEFPKVDTTPSQFALVRDSSINELTICLGNGGSRDGWFRVLRNLNPRYEPTAWIPAGTVLRAPKRVGELYRNNCVQGERAVLAGALVRSSKYVPAGVVLAETPPAASASSSSAAKPRSKQREYRVRSGDSLLAIAREHSCDLTVLAKANRLQAPNYMIRPGQRLKLKGCEG
jgi:membrane-bound lytic murein transglycosylase D